jgi:hypothetical protein
MADSHHTCRTCGNQFVRSGGKGRAPIYCSRKCHPSRSRPLQSGPVCNCKLCGKEFRPKVKDRTSCCSRECGLKWNGIQASVRANGGRVWVSVRRKPCPTCAKMHGHKSVYCSEQCRPLAYTPIRRQKDCAKCGASFVPRPDENGNVTFCSDECRASAKQALKKADKKLRKALTRGARGGQSVKPDVVFDRDGWRCQICKCKTMKDKRGTSHPRAPELDHIIPVSKGGVHTYGNTQCTCRNCNIKKGATIQGQLNLFPMG